MELFFSPILWAMAVHVIVQSIFDFSILRWRQRIGSFLILLLVTLAMNAAVLFAVKFIIEPRFTKPLFVFMTRLLIVMGVQAPVYSFLFRKGWDGVCTSLLLSRVAFTITALLIGAVGASLALRF